jgi:hypothetical protein
MAVLVKERFGPQNVYVVHDGSIQDGIEIVSHPFSWQSYKKTREQWDDLLNYVKSKGWSGEGKRCGFHVHMTKNAFQPFQLYKFLKFFYEEKNKPFVYVMAGRKATSYSIISKKDVENLPKVAKNKKNEPAEGSHYHAVNLNNHDTVEVRLFKGLTEPFEFHKNIEFLMALFEFSRDHKPTQMNGKKFTKYATAHAKRFPCLVEWLIANGQIKGGK